MLRNRQAPQRCTAHRLDLPYRVNHILRRGVRAVLMLGLFACNKSTEPEPRELAMIVGHSALDPRIATSINGGTVEVSVLTYAGLCDDLAATEVHIVGMEILIVPYNTARGCVERTVKHVEHRIALDVSSTGSAVLRIRGRDVTAGTIPGDTITVERRIDIR